jgi:hypothetical protein
MPVAAPRRHLQPRVRGPMCRELDERFMPQDAGSFKRNDRPSITFIVHRLSTAETRRAIACIAQQACFVGRSCASCSQHGSELWKTTWFDCSQVRKQSCLIQRFEIQNRSLQVRSGPPNAGADIHGATSARRPHESVTRSFRTRCAGRRARWRCDTRRFAIEADAKARLSTARGGVGRFAGKSAVERRRRCFAGGQWPPTQSIGGAFSGPRTAFTSPAASISGAHVQRRRSLARRRGAEVLPGYRPHLPVNLTAVRPSCQVMYRGAVS